MSIHEMIRVAAVIGIMAITSSAFGQQATKNASSVLSHSSPGDSLNIPSAPNLRDLGGYTTRDGAVVVRGLAYRSSQLNPIGPGDLERIAQLGLKSDYDLRTTDERQARPDQLPPGVNDVWLNVMADSKSSDAAQLGRLLQNPKEANTALGDGKAEAMFAKGYREFVSLPSAKQGYRQLFLSLGDQNKVPGLFHCTGGKDRTGWAAAALLTLLGVPKDKVMEDYLRSNEYVLPAYKGTIDSFVAAGGDRKILLAALGVKAEYLEAAFDEMYRRYGTIESYFSDGLGIDAAGQQALKDLYLVKR